MRSYRIRNKANITILSAGIAILLTSLNCKGQRSVQQMKPQPYHESLEHLRPTKPGVPIEKTMSSESSPKVPASASPPVQFAVNTAINTVLDSISRLNCLQKFIDGFTLQVYSGQDHNEVKRVEAKFKENFPNIAYSVQFRQPKFRMTGGAYLTRIQAQRDWAKVRVIFPNAVLVPEKIAVR